jgi:hypothetical protein
MITAKNNAIKLFSLRTAVFFVLSVCLNLSIPAQTASKVEDLVKSLSGEKLKVESKATPYKLVGDFNGDKIEDVAVIVSLSDTVEKTAKTVKVAYPYYFGKEVDAEDLALFIIHGKGKGWQFAQKSSVLFLGRNSALIFQKARLGEKGDGMELDKDKRGKVSIYFVTEGSSGTLKWNGKKYVWTESHP